MNSYRIIGGLKGRRKNTFLGVLIDTDRPHFERCNVIHAPRWDKDKALELCERLKVRFSDCEFEAVA